MRKFDAGIFLIMLIFMLLYNSNNFVMGIIFQALLWAALAGSWNILGGFAGQFSIAHSAFIGIGAYTSSLLYIHLGVSPWLGMLAGAAISCMIGIFLGAICFKLKGHFFVLATLAFGQLMLIIAVYWRSLTKGSEGLSLPFNTGFLLMAFTNRLPYVIIAFLYLVLVISVTIYIDKSKLGYFLTAYREDDDAARIVGVNTFRARLLASGISSSLAAVGGTLYAQYMFYIDPINVFGINIAAQAPLIAIVGGLGTSMGPVFGAILILPLTQLLRAWVGGSLHGLHLIIYGVILIIVLFLIPEGLYPRFQQAFYRLIKREEKNAGTKKSVKGV
ncbi:MAG: branched-chain amino acid ABC transporter permease [Dethiobacter sp.]|jgi:branched-chain amino acid transport system permease protein|nr:branched-chain amino acid ABC transporter permease [Dethiobacter sp.]